MESEVSLGCAPNGDGAAPPEFRHAVVWDGAVATPYSVTGAGAPVVLLCEPACVPSAKLLCDLAARFRIFLPDMSAAALASCAFSVWLRGFLDGLGLGEVSLVASPAHALAVLGFALVESPRVEKLVLLVRDAVDPAAPAGAIREDLVGVGRPLLVVRVNHTDPAPEELADEVVRFMTGGA